jgi:hypothetical protein
MRVLLLGAGASKPAGYPLAVELISATEEFVHGAREVMLRTYWNRWDSWRHNAEGIEWKLLSNPNPEVVFSLPDLYEAALQADDIEQWTRALKKWKTDGLTEEELREYQDYWRSQERKKLTEAQRALGGFLECLGLFFLYRHHDDAKHQAQRDYLRQHFKRLSGEDAIISLNWDTTAERTLFEEGDWNPIRGYGFYRDLRTMPCADPLPADFPTESKVTVLKLHGSIGWHPSESGEIYLDHPRFLSEFDFQSNAGRVDLMDPAAPKSGPPEGSVLLYPSFLKQLNGAVMQQIWRFAAKCLENAQRIDVYGYSLPDSDVGIRALLNVLRFRSQSNEVDLRVHDPSKDAQDRWRQFLGDRACIDGRRIEEGPAED